MTNELATKQSEIIQAPSQEGSMLQIIERAASDPNYPMENLEKLLAMKERWDANEAKKAYVRGMNEFKKNPPTVIKNKHVYYKNRNGDVTEYDHADLAQASAIIAQALSDYGFTHHWETETLEGGVIQVTCIITHDLGHSEKVSLRAGSDQSGGKNNIQAVGSAVTYLQRYTLLSAVGLAAKGADDDGKGPATVETITEEQAANLQALIDEVGADKQKFLQWCKSDSLETIPVSKFKACVKALEDKRKQ